MYVDDVVGAEGASCFEASPPVLSPGESGRAVVGFDVTEDPAGGRLALEVETTSDSGQGRFDLIPVAQWKP